MVVSRGLGNSLFPLRVGNRPEGVAATLHSAPSVEGQQQHHAQHQHQ